MCPCTPTIPGLFPATRRNAVHPRTSPFVRCDRSVLPIAINLATSESAPKASAGRGWEIVREEAAATCGQGSKYCITVATLSYALLYCTVTYAGNGLHTVSVSVLSIEFGCQYCSDEVIVCVQRCDAILDQLTREPRGYSLGVRGGVDSLLSGL